MFCDWMMSNNHYLKGRQMMAVTIERLKMPWRDETNKIDCGIYTMRHMETYMGQKAKDWKIGLGQNAFKQLRYLRIKYCKTLLTAEINNQRDEIIKAAK